MSSRLERLFHRSARLGRTPRRWRIRPDVQQLEGRQLLSAVSFNQGPTIPHAKVGAIFQSARWTDGPVNDSLVGCRGGPRKNHTERWTIGRAIQSSPGATLEDSAKESVRSPQRAPL
jgi:hypothetical protein